MKGHSIRLMILLILWGVSISVSRDTSRATVPEVKYPSIGRLTWSSDGSKIAFDANLDNPEEDEIYTVDVTSKQIQQLTHTLGAQESAPAWAPDGSAIAYERDGNIWLMNPDGTNQRQITQDSGYRPVWSPDGEYLAIATDASTIRGSQFPSGADIMIISRGGAEEKWFSTARADEFPYDWSPDGSYLVYERLHNNGTMAVFRRKLDWSNMIQLTDNTEYVLGASISPDGTRIVYHTDGKLWLMNSDGTGKTVLFEKSGLWMTRPRWSPLGTKIAFLGVEYDETGVDGPMNIYLINPDGTGLEQITFFTGFSSAQYPIERKILSRKEQTISTSFERSSHIGGGGESRREAISSFVVLALAILTHPLWKFLKP